MASLLELIIIGEWGLVVSRVNRWKVRRGPVTSAS